MIDKPLIFLRFPDETTGLSELETAGFIVQDEDGVKQVVTASHSYALDVIGIITEGGEWDEDGNVIIPPITLNGWHVNYLGEVPVGWDQYIVTPENPVRLFF